MQSLTTGSATGYLYDADGNRVAKGTVTPSPSPASQPISCDPTTNGFQFTENYVLGMGGEELTMQDGAGNWQRTNVDAGGRLIGTYDLVAGQPALHFHLEDPLGTRRMQISGMLANLGQPETDFQSLPFGDQLASYQDPNGGATGDDATPLHFTGKERDQESGNDYFGARYYASTMGRFLSPDWSAKEEPVPYAKLDNPQTLNLYQYMRNNPLGGVDADGHDPGTAVMDVIEQIANDHPELVDAALQGIARASTAVEEGTINIGGAALGVGTFLFTAGVASTAGPRQDEIQHTGNSSNEAGSPEPQTSTSGAGARQGGGTIYRVPGSGTRSGKPYIGRHNKSDPAKTRRSNDGRDRSQAKVVDTYNASDTQEGRVKEQQHIDQNGGVQNLDNKRNEIKKPNGQ